MVKKRTTKNYALKLTRKSCQELVTLATSVSDPDPDPCGSKLKWLPWIRIRIRIQDSQNGV